MHVVSTNFAKTLVAKLKMTSYCDVTNRVYSVTKTTILHCYILEFGRGASNQAVAPSTTRPLHATDCTGWHWNISMLFLLRTNRTLHFLFWLSKLIYNTFLGFSLTTFLWIVPKGKIKLKSHFTETWKVHWKKKDSDISQPIKLKRFCAINIY